MDTKLRNKISNAYTCLIRRCLGTEANYNREVEVCYKDVDIAEEWLPKNNGRQNFTNWWMSQHNSHEKGVSIDKDILSRGLATKCYSPETCILAQKTTQMQATRLIKKNNRTGYRGVQVRNDRGLTDGKRYRAELRVNFVRYNLGSYYTIEDAAYAVNYFISNSVADQPLNIIDMSKVDTAIVYTNELLQRSLKRCLENNPE